MRLGDIAANVALLPVDPTNLGVIPAAGIGGQPKTGLNEILAAQASLMALSVSGGGGSDTLDVKFQESDAPEEAEGINGYNGVDDGSRKLREGATTNVLLAIPFTPAVGLTVYQVKLMLSKLGAPTGHVWVEIQGDSTGDPDGTAIGGVSRKVDVANIGAAIEEVSFFADCGIDLTGATAYWLVITGDYTASATDCIQVHYDTATSACKQYNGTVWAVTTDENFWFKLEQLIFSDVSSLVHAQITEGFANPMDTWERLEIPMLMRKPALRAFYTPSGGAWTVGHALAIGYPKTQPLA